KPSGSSRTYTAPGPQTTAKVPVHSPKNTTAGQPAQGCIRVTSKLMAVIAKAPMSRSTRRVSAGRKVTSRVISGIARLGGIMDGAPSSWRILELAHTGELVGLQ